MNSIGRYSKAVLLAVMFSLGTGVLAAPADKDLAAGLSLMRKGKFVEARPLIEKACQTDPHNAFAKFTLATLEDSAAAAESLYVLVAADTTAPDSLRAASDSRLGELYFVKKQYRLSAVAYGHARRFRKTPETALAWARSQLMAGARDSAQIVADSFMSAKVPYYARQAAWISGECRLGAKEFAKAYDDFGLALERCDTCLWYLPALEGRYRCAVALDSGSAVKTLRAEIEKKYPQALESELIADTVATRSTFVEEDVAPVVAPTDVTVAPLGKPATDKPAKPESSATTPVSTIKATVDATTVKESVKAKGALASSPAPHPAEELSAGPVESYAIQVGSFGTRLNANALAAKLKPDFPEVVVVEAVVKDVSYYRVRIGTFASIVEARAFADRQFKGRSIRFQIVKR